MPEFSPDMQGYEALVGAQKKEMAALSESGAPARKTLKKQQKRTVERYIDTARETALVDNVLRKATPDEYRNLSVEESPKTFPQKKFIGKSFSGTLGGHEVNIFYSGGYDRSLEIDGILIHSQRKMDNGPGTVVKPSADEDIVDEFFKNFGLKQIELSGETEEKTGDKFIPKKIPKKFPNKMG
ncbi:MAG: hypothetical protein Q8Q10_03455 [bacterium]|nr:hypothetical protein [bacterium]